MGGGDYACTFCLHKIGSVTSGKNQEDMDDIRCFADNVACGIVKAHVVCRHARVWAEEVIALRARTPDLCGGFPHNLRPVVVRRLCRVIFHCAI